MTEQNDTSRPCPADPVAAQFWQACEQAKQENMAGFKALAMRGIQLDGVTMSMAMVECLYDSISEAMGPAEGPRFAELARLRWEQRTAQGIKEALDNGTKASLSLAGGFTPTMIRELAKATNTFGGT